MNKTLNSGIQVDDKEYYALLEWKDTNYYSFCNWMDANMSLEKLTFSINRLSLYKYNLLLQYAKENGLVIT